MEELLKNISSNDLEKLKMLFSILPGNETKEIVTLRVFRDEYLNYIKQGKSKSYLISVRLAFNHLINFFGEQHSVQSLQQKDTENFINTLQQKVKSVSHSASRGGGYVVYYCNLKAAFNKAKDWGYIKENYFTKVRLPKRQKLAPVFINSDQLSVISNQIKNEIVKDVVVFAFYTGMRLNEIVNLRWKNVDLENRVITVGDENFTTKGRNQRFIPIDKALEALLRMKSVEFKVQKENPKIRLITLARDASTSLSIKKGFVFCKDNGDVYRKESQVKTVYPRDFIPHF